MEPNTQYQTPAPIPTAAAAAPLPAQPKRRRPWIVIILLLALVAGSSYGVYTWQHQKLNNAQQSLSSANAKVNTLIADQKLYTLPSHSDFGPQCKSKDNSELIVAALTPQPVDNYQAYIEECANDASTPARVVAFKVNSDGTRSFAFGAGTSEPMCISSKIIDATAAKNISKQTLVPICKTF